MQVQSDSDLEVVMVKKLFIFDSLLSRGDDVDN